jgi:hypothetical protein
MTYRLIDLPGMADLERTALMRSSYADADAREHYPEIDQCSTALFGLTADEADAVERPAGWDGVERLPLNAQVQAFETEGWDVTHQRRPLRMLSHFNVQLWLAIRGVAGRLPVQAPVVDEEKPAADWGASLQSQATRFRRDRR